MMSVNPKIHYRKKHLTMQITKKSIALLCICVILATNFNYDIMAAESTSYGNTSSDLSDYGFVVDKTVYNKTCTAVLQSRSILSNGRPIFTQNTRVYICREKNTYNDVILTFAELVPKAYTSNGDEYRSYPESLTVSCQFVNNSAGAEYKTSSPKTQTVSSSYSIGCSASIGNNVGISGNVTINGQKNVLVIKNLSNSGINKFELCKHII